MLGRLFVLIVMIGVIAPSLYAYALETTPESSVAHAAHARVTCMKVRTSISNRTASFQQMSERHLAVIDAIYHSATTYAKSAGIVIDAVSHSAVEAARVAAKSAIITLANSEDALNCEDTATAQEAGELRTNIQLVSEQLRAYRAAVRSVLQSLGQG